MTYVSPEATFPSHARPRPTRVDHGLALLRIALGWVFLWAFLDKLLGLGFATTAGNAWIRGGSPTHGFLTFGTTGPFAGLFQGIAGNVVVDWLFMLGLVGIGIALLTGIAVRIGAFAGMVMLFLMWLAVLPPTNNPFLDDHIVYIVALYVVQASRAADVWSLRRVWVRVPYVARHPSLH